jgi:hypothetical protein
MLSNVRQQCSVILRRKFENIDIRPRLLRLACFSNGDYIVTELTKGFDDWQRKVFVGVKWSYSSSFLVFANLAVNLLAMISNVTPRVD